MKSNTQIKILNWITNEEIFDDEDIISRNLFSQKHQSETAEELLSKFTFLNSKEWESFLNFIIKSFNLKLKGIGVELGAGCAGFSNTVVKIQSNVEKIYAVEIVPDVVKLLQTKVIDSYNNKDKVIPVTGSFDEIRLPDNSVDLIIEYDSLHHSPNIEKTLKESSRILKEGGLLIALDRVHFDTMLEEQRTAQLNIEYSNKFKQEHGISIEKNLTRKDNGENEYTETEWRKAFINSSLEIEDLVLMHRKSIKRFIISLLTLLPYKIRLINGRLQPNLDRLPLKFFLLYMLPFYKKLWRSRYLNLNVKLSNKSIFGSKSIIIAKKLVKK